MPKSAAKASVPPINMLVYREDHARITRHAARMAADTGRTVSYADAVRDMLDRLDLAQEEARCHACGSTDCPAAGKPYVDDCPGWQEAEARLARGGYLPTRPLPLPGSREEASGD